MPLVLVPTPLGNLGDVTLRSLETLRSAALIVAEDTRVARKLLNALGIPRPQIWSYREQNAERSTTGILERARAELVAVTCDAGLPGISDPGSDLISAARSAGIAVEVLPGPSAAFGVAALSGFPLKRFSFEGFPARSATARRDAFTRALLGGCTTIWFESPQRIRATLADLAEVARDARVFLVREYTKLHEQQLAGTPSEVAAGLPESVRGEISFAIAPHHPTFEPALAPSGGDVDAAIDALLAQDLRLGDIAKQLARRGFGQRGALYDRASARRAAGKGAPSAAESTD